MKKIYERWTNIKKSFRSNTSIETYDLPRSPKSKYLFFFWSARPTTTVDGWRAEKREKKPPTQWSADDERVEWPFMNVLAHHIDNTSYFRYSHNSYEKMC